MVIADVLEQIQKADELREAIMEKYIIDRAPFADIEGVVHQGIDDLDHGVKYIANLKINGRPRRVSVSLPGREREFGDAADYYMRLAKALGEAIAADLVAHNLTVRG